MKPLTRRQMAWRAAQDIADGAYVNLGIGLPTLVSDYLPPGREIVVHSENGILGMGPAPPNRARRTPTSSMPARASPRCCRAARSSTTTTPS